MRNTVPTENEVFRRDVSEDITVTSYVGYGRNVSLEISTGTLLVDLGLEPDQARTVALALMDAAAAAEK